MEILRFILRGQSSSQPRNLLKQLKCQLLLKQADFGEDIEFVSHRTSPWSSGKCVRFDAGRSRVRLSAGSYQDFVDWYCSLLTRRTVCGRAAGNTPRTQNKASDMKPDIVQAQSWRYKTTVVIKRQEQNTT